MDDSSKESIHGISDSMEVAALARLSKEPPPKSSNKAIKSEPGLSSEDEDQDSSYLNLQIRLKCDPDYFPEGTDWSSQTFFNCYLCGVETDGFRNSVNHVRQVHPQALTRDKNAPCIVCPKLFARMDHLKKHVWSHVNKISPGIPPHFVGPSGGGHVGGASDSNRTRPKMEKLPLLIDTTVTTPTDPALYGQLRFKMDPETFPDGVDWSTQTYFNCYLCGVEVDGFRDGVKHVRHAHPETLIEDKACPCIICPKRFGRMDHLKNHVYAHVNKIRPGLPKHNMSTFVRSSTSRSSLKHRLFAPNPDENEMDDEEDDEEFENYVKKNEIKENSMITSKPETEQEKEESSAKSPTTSSDTNSAADWSTRLIFQCRLCQKQCDGFHMAVSHFKHVHPLAEELEPEVDDSKEDPQQVQSSEKAEEQCPLCPKVFRKIDNLKVHVWRHVNRAFPGTPKHPEMVNNTFGRGKPSWTEEREWPCERCGKQVKGISEFVEHLENMHPNQCGIVCPICDKELPSKRRLKIHVVIHSDKKATCPHCGKDFSEGYKLRRHLREVHDKLKEHVCSTCGKTFARGDKLFQHELIHVSKTEQPVEWIPILTDASNISNDTKNNDDSTTDTSSDSSEDEGQGGSITENNQGDFNDIDNFLETEVKEENFDADDIFSALDDYEDDWCLTCSLTCYECQKIIEGFEACIQHSKNCHKKNSKPFLCISCPKTFSSKDLLKNHVKRHVFNNDNDHEFSALEKQYWNCQRCESKAFKGITKYINHLDDNHPNEEKILCPACPSLFENIKNLKIHTMEHVPNSTNTETNNSSINGKNNTENVNADSSFDFDQIEEDSDVSDMDEDAFLEDMDLDDDYDDLDDEDFKIVEQKTIKPAPKNTDTTIKRKRGRPRKKEIVSSDEEFEVEPVIFKKENIFDDFLFDGNDVDDNVFNFHDKLQQSDEINNKTGKKNNSSTTKIVTSERDTRKLRTKRIQENKSIQGKVEDSNIFDKKFSCHLCTENVKGIQAAYDHMIQVHPCLNSDEQQDDDIVKPEIDVDLPNVKCVDCGAIFKGIVQFQIHLWRHYNKFEPTTTNKRGSRQRISSSDWLEHQWFGCRHCDHNGIEGLSAFIEHIKTSHNHNTGLECPFCEKFNGNTKKELSNHVQFHNREKPSCGLCGKNFFNSNKLKRHIIEVHQGQKNHMCNTCGKCFARPDKLRDHEKVHLREPGTVKRGRRKIKVESDDDDELVQDGDEESDHLEVDSNYGDQPESDETPEDFVKRQEEFQNCLDSVNQVDVENGQAWHQRATFTCYQCQTNVTSVENASYHMTTFHPDHSPFHCILCPKQMPDMSCLMVHLWRHLQKAGKKANSQNWLELQFWRCRTCQQDIKGLKNFWHHQEQDHKFEQLVCPGCDRTDFATMKSLKKHVRILHGVKLPCEFCGKFFTGGSKMRRHVVEVHEGRKNHTCLDCGKGFARSEKLRAHQRLHKTGVDKPFLCHQCGRGFGRQEHVTRHQKICGKRKNKSRMRLRADAPITDEEVEKIYQELGITSLTDDTDEKVACKFCNRQFRNKRYMMEHYVRNHREANQKLPHRCEVCGKGFKVIRDLVRHHNRPHTKYFHSEEYLSLKHVCPEDGCCRRFKKERALNKHMLIHSNIRDHKCDHCDMAFCTRQTLRTHLKMQHKIVLPTESKKGKKLGPRNKNKIKRPPAENNLIEDQGLQHAMETQSVHSEDSYVPQGYFHPGHWMGFTLDPPFAPAQVQTIPRQKITSIPVDIRHMQDLREQDNISVHSDIHSDIHSDRMSEPPPPPTPPIPSRPPVIQEQTPPPPPQAAPLIQQTQQTFHQHQIFNAINDSTPNNVNSEDTKILQQKRRMPPALLTDEQKQIVAEEMNTANLGPICSVCGKVFKTKDALDFHIMYTKLPGHDVLLQQKVRNNYAEEAMRVSAKLQMEGHNMPTDYGPPTPIVSYDQPPTPAGSNMDEEVFDAKTGIFVKPEAESKEDLQALMPPPPPVLPVEIDKKPEIPKKISKSKIFKCMECHRGFKREIKLIKHVTKKHSKKKVPTITTIGKGEPAKHVEGSLKLTQMGCPDCMLLFSSEEEMMGHFTLPPHQPPPFSQPNKCPVVTCDMNFPNRSKLILHMREGRHGQPCPQCGKSFPKLDNLELHIRSHSTDRPFTCEHCDKSYKDAPSLYSHIQTHHSIAKRSHLCSECGASFMKSDHLKRHINSTHRKIKTIKCGFCDMMFSDKYKAKIHERKHTGEAPYMCDICSKTFKRKEALDNHAIVHQDLPKDFKCVTCGAAFNSQQYLNRHISRHFAEKKHKCRDCDMAFIDKRDYIVHVSKVHANHRPFACSSCGMAYKTKQGLTSHLKSHPNGDCINNMRRSRGPSKKEDRPYSCDECDKKFTKESKLENHKKTHQRTSNNQQQATTTATTTTEIIQTLACPVCDKVFTDQIHLKNHIRLDHQPNPITQHETQTFVLKPAVVQPTVVESNLLPSSLQQALTQHHKAVGIQQSLQNSARMIQQPLPSYQQHLYAQHVVAPQQHVRSNPQQQQQQQQHQQQQQQQQQQAQHHQLIAATTQDLTGGSTSHLASAASEFYQHYAANIANFNQMYKQN